MKKLFFFLVLLLGLSTAKGQVVEFYDTTATGYEIIKTTANLEDSLRGHLPVEISSPLLYGALNVTDGTVDTIVLSQPSKSLYLTNLENADTLYASPSGDFPSTLSIILPSDEDFKADITLDTLFIKIGANADSGKTYRAIIR